VKTTKIDKARTPSLLFTNNLDLIIEAYILNIYSVRNYRYQDRRFYVLDRFVPNFSAVYLPKLQANVYEEALKCSTLIYSQNKKDQLEIEKFKIKYKNVFENFIEEQQTSCIDNNLFEEFWCELKNYIPRKYLDEVKQIECVNSKVGTIGTQLTWHKKDSEKIEVVKRKDADYSYYFYLILLDRLNRYSKELQVEDWNSRMVLINYLVLNSNLSKYFKNVENIISSLNDIKMMSLRKESNDYLKDLGYLFGENIIIKGNEILIDGKQINCTKSEFNFLKVLIENSNQTVDFESLAKSIWGKDYLEKFSFAAIVKIVERIRAKFIKINVKSISISSVRGVGYRLNIYNLQAEA
jgi:DNA-binding winged helix-turn-helix (wHTH) protein